MFFKFIRVIARTILAVVNGNAHYQNQDKLPEGNYILVAPHRTWWDPVYTVSYTHLTLPTIYSV